MHPGANGTLSITKRGGHNFLHDLVVDKTQQLVRDCGHDVVYRASRLDAVVRCLQTLYDPSGLDLTMC